MNRRRNLRIISHPLMDVWGIIGSGNKKLARVVQTLNEALDFASSFAPKRYKRIGDYIDGSHFACNLNPDH